MNFTVRRIINKIVAVLIIMIMTLADFSLVGANVISYAIDMVVTNNNNVEFSVYFMNENEEKTTEIESTINAEDLKMYVEISVKNEGYFNGEVTLNDSSFKFNENISNEYVKEITGSTLKLKQINAGTTVTIGLNVSYNNLSEIKQTSLNQDNEVGLTGTYVNSKKNVEIKGKTSVKVNWTSPEDAQAKLATQILTNSIYKINDANKRIVQVLINSKLNNNSYPVEETKIELNVPSDVEEVKVHSRSTYATNGNENFDENNYEYNAEEGKLTIILKNEEQEGKVNWNKNVKDTLVATYIYPEDKNFSEEKINSNATIKTYDNKELKAESQSIISENIDGIITNEIRETESSIYKGKIYTGEERQYTSTTVLNIDYADLVETIKISEKEAVFKTESEEVKANIQYVETKIEKAKFDKIFGEDGVITIYDQDGATIANINKDSEVEDGNIIVKYNTGVTKIIIKTSKPISNGILDIKHTKSILDSKLKREEVKNLVEIKEEVIAKYNDNESQVNKTNTIELKETEMQAKIQMNKESLTTVSTNEGIIAQATLYTYGEEKELYKNPTIRIELPKEVENIKSAQIRIIYGNGLKIKQSKIDNKNGIKVCIIELEGEQKEYSKETVEGTIIQLRFDCDVDALSTNSQEKVKLKVSNENSTNDISSETSIKIINPETMITVNNLSDYGENNNIELEVKEKKKDIVNNIQIINNEEGTISDVKIIGDLPTDNTKNNVGISLENGLSTNISDAKVYYTENENATEDISNKENKWQEKITKNTKKYLIVVDELEKAQKLKANYEIEIPENLENNLYAETGYKVSYLDGTTSKTKHVTATSIKLYTEEAVEEGKQLEQTIKASVGGIALSDNEDVRSGEIIKYEITLENKGNSDIEGIEVEAIIPEGTTRVVLEDIAEDEEERNIWR